MDDKFWYLKNCSLFERLTPQQIQQLESKSKARQFKKGELVYVPSDQGESVLLLAAGRIKIYHVTGDGKQALLALIEPGELFGELAVFEGGIREEYAEAMEKSTVVLIPGETIQRLMEAHTEVSLGVTKLMGLRRKRVEQRLKALLFRSNRERVVHLLVELAEKYGRQTPQGVVLEIKLSHQDLANIIGSTRETVTVVLGDLQTEGGLAVHRRQILLKRLDQLAASVEMPVPKVKQDKGLEKKPAPLPQFDL